MGTVCDSCFQSVINERKPKKTSKSETMRLMKGKTASHVAFNEICSAKTKFQCTLVTTRSNKTDCIIIKSENMSFIHLFNAGYHRITDVTKLTSNNEFYASIRRFKKGVLDETEIQKYQLTPTHNKENEINIKFAGTVFKGLYKDKGINMEGIEVIESDDDKLRGFLLCNNYFAKPPNSNLYFLNVKGKPKIIYSFNDKGIAENGGILQYKGFGKDGYLILPQFLGLGTKAIFKDKNIKKFIKWSLENNENAFLYFINKNEILELIECNDDDEKRIFETKIKKVSVMLTNNYKSNKSLFVKYKHCENEGVEAISIDNENNVLLTIEYTENKDTFDCIVTGKMIGIEHTDNKDYILQLIINPCQYVKVDNNGGGKNHGQKALLYIR